MFESSLAKRRVQVERVLGGVESACHAILAQLAGQLDEQARVNALLVHRVVAHGFVVVGGVQLVVAGHVELDVALGAPLAYEVDVDLVARAVAFAQAPDLLTRELWKLLCCRLLHESLANERPALAFRLVHAGRVGDDLLDERGSLAIAASELRIGRRQLVHIDVDECREQLDALGFVRDAERLVHDAQTVEYERLEEAAEAVATGHEAVADGHRYRAHVVAEASVLGRHRMLERVRFVGSQRRTSTAFVYEAERGREQIGVVVAVQTVEESGEALEAHARVDHGRVQRREVSATHTIVCHEDDVPDLDAALGARVHQVARVASAYLSIVVDLGARAARSDCILPDVSY